MRRNLGRGYVPARDRSIDVWAATRRLEICQPPRMSFPLFNAFRHLEPLLESSRSSQVEICSEARRRLKEGPQLLGTWVPIVKANILVARFTHLISRMFEGRRQLNVLYELGQADSTGAKRPSARGEQSARSSGPAAMATLSDGK